MKQQVLTTSFASGGAERLRLEVFGKIRHYGKLQNVGKYYKSQTETDYKERNQINKNRRK